jgi:hypothetical protein
MNARTPTYSPLALYVALVLAVHHRLRTLDVDVLSTRRG